MAAFSASLRCRAPANHPDNHCFDYVSSQMFFGPVGRLTHRQHILDGGPRTRRGALFQVPLHPGPLHSRDDSLCNTSPSLSATAHTNHTLELPPRHLLPQRRDRDLALGPVGALSDDLRGLLRAPQLNSARTSLASVALPAQVLPGGARGQRGRLGADDRG